MTKGQVTVKELLNVWHFKRLYIRGGMACMIINEHYESNSHVGLNLSCQLAHNNTEIHNRTRTVLSLLDVTNSRNARLQSTPWIWRQTTRLGFSYASNLSLYTNSCSCTDAMRTCEKCPRSTGSIKYECVLTMCNNNQHGLYSLLSIYRQEQRHQSDSRVSLSYGPTVWNTVICYAWQQPVTHQHHRISSFI